MDKTPRSVDRAARTGPLAERQKLIGPRFLRHPMYSYAKQYLYPRVIKDDTPDGCWIYKPNADPRNQQLQCFGRRWRPAAFFYLLKHGVIPRGRVVRSRCGIPGCVNPEHHFVIDPDLEAEQARKRAETHQKRVEVALRVMTADPRATAEKVAYLSQLEPKDIRAIRRKYKIKGVRGRRWGPKTVPSSGWDHEVAALAPPPIQGC